MIRPYVRAAILLFTAMMLCSCAPFKVVPRVEATPESINAVASSANLELRAQLLSEDDSMKFFDGNLWLAGVIPVRAALINRGQAVLKAKKLEFKLTDASGKRFKYIKNKDAINMMIKYYGYRLYNYQLTKEMEERFASHSLNFDKELPPDESRQGLIFFKQEKEAAQPLGLRLQLTGISSESVIAIGLN